MHRTADAQSLALHLQQQLNPFCIEAPIEPRDLIDQSCGVGDLPNEPIAQQLIDHARQLLVIDSDASSELERGWQRESAIGQGNSTEAIEVARALLTPADDSPIQKLRRGISLLRDKGCTDTELFRKLSLFAGEYTRPILLVVSDPADRWLQTIRFLTSATEVALHARLIIVVGPPDWDRLRASLESHTIALLSHGLIDVDPPSKPVLRYAEEPDRTPNDPVSPSLAWDEASIELKERATRAVQIARGIPTPANISAPVPKEYAEARSLAEALLYAALQASPVTKDLFALNADGGFPFGPRQAEIDLLCASLRIAIEVDGYFHFQDNNAYRRDRAKDFLMQAEGLLVLRFLAEDVTDRLDLVLADIFKAVKLRRTKG